MTKKEIIIKSLCRQLVQVANKKKKYQKKLNYPEQKIKISVTYFPVQLEYSKKILPPKKTKSNFFPNWNKIYFLNFQSLKLYRKFKVDLNLFPMKI